MDLSTLDFLVFNPSTAQALFTAAALALAAGATVIFFILLHASEPSRARPLREKPLDRWLRRIHAWACGMHGARREILAVALIGLAAAVYARQEADTLTPWAAAAIYTFLSMALLLVLTAFLVRPRLWQTLASIGTRSRTQRHQNHTMAEQIDALRTYEGKGDAPGLYPLLYQSMLSRLQNLHLARELPLRWQDLLRDAAGVSVLASVLFLLLGKSASLLHETVSSLQAEDAPTARRTPAAPEEPPESSLAQDEPHQRPPSRVSKPETGASRDTAQSTPQASSSKASSAANAEQEKGQDTQASTENAPAGVAEPSAGAGAGGTPRGEERSSPPTASKSSQGGQPGEKHGGRPALEQLSKDEKAGPVESDRSSPEKPVNPNESLAKSEPRPSSSPHPEEAPESPPSATPAEPSGNPSSEASPSQADEPGPSSVSKRPTPETSGEEGQRVSSATESGKPDAQSGQGREDDPSSPGQIPGDLEAPGNSPQPPAQKTSAGSEEKDSRQDEKDVPRPGDRSPSPGYTGDPEPREGRDAPPSGCSGCSGGGGEKSCPVHGPEPRQGGNQAQDTGAAGEGPNSERGPGQAPQESPSPDGASSTGEKCAGPGGSKPGQVSQGGKQALGQDEKSTTPGEKKPGLGQASGKAGGYRGGDQYGSAPDTRPIGDRRPVKNDPQVNYKEMKLRDDSPERRGRGDAAPPDAEPAPAEADAENESVDPARVATQHNPTTELKPSRYVEPLPLSPQRVPPEYRSAFRKLFERDE